MSRIAALSPEKLRARIDPKSIQVSRTAGRARLPLPHQPRALQALELGIDIVGNEHNVYVSGEVGLGRRFLVESFLHERSTSRAIPSDWIYLHNFSDPDHSLAVALPPGDGKRFRSRMTDLVKVLKHRIPSIFLTEGYLRKKDRLSRRLRDVRETLLSRLDDQARAMGFELDVNTKGVLALSPVMDGQAVTPEEYDRLTPSQRRILTNRTEEIMGPVEKFSRDLTREEAAYAEKSRRLDRRMVSGLLDETFTSVENDFQDQPSVQTYLRAAKADILENLDTFRVPLEKSDGQASEAGGSSEDQFLRYEVNLFVDHGDSKGCPVVFEDNPTYFNLLGSIQRETEMGSLYTDFTLLKAGSIHRANGGFLVIRAEDLMDNLSAWEGLLRCLNSGQCRIEDPSDTQDHVRTRTIAPEPIPFRLRIILIGSEDLYETLLMQDERFGKYFKLKAHLQEWVDRSASTIRRYVNLLVTIGARNGLLPFEPDALAGLVNYSSRLADDQKKLSLYLSDLRDVMVESDALARSRQTPSVTGNIVETALRLRDYRSNLYEEEFLYEYDREVIQVPTKGDAVGRVNGLSVRYVGDYVLALPHQISCTVGVGHGGVLDLEREAELGGPIHTKGMMILKACLLRLFAQDKALIFTGNLCFEQSYAHVDGDSAAGAELAALLSALSGIPVRLSLAFTGAVSQTGRILAVGEVTRKVEGFFEVCRRRKLTGDQGVIIPADNVVNLMLKEEVVSAVEAGRFHIYPVRTIEEAMELLTGLPAGKTLRKGGFSQGSLYQAVDLRLRHLARLAERELRKPGRRCSSWPK